MKYPVAKRDGVCMSQIPLAYRITATVKHVPSAFSSLSQVTFASFTEYRKEIFALMKSIPPYPGEGQGCLNLIQTCIQELYLDDTIRLHACQVYYILLTENEPLMREWIHPILLKELVRKINLDDTLLHSSFREFITHCIHYDLENRYIISRDDLLSWQPCYVKPGARDWLIVAFGHYHRKWIQAFLREIRVPDHEYIMSKVNRLIELVRNDATIYSRALSNCRGEGALTSYFNRFGPGDWRKAIAFTYRRPAAVWECFQWPYTIQDVRRWRMYASDGAMTPSPREMAQMYVSFLF